MLALTLRSIQGRFANFSGSFIAITATMTVIAATAILLLSAAQTNLRAERLAGVPLVLAIQPGWHAHIVSGQVDEGSIGSGPRIPLVLADRVSAIPGVADVIPDLHFYAQAVSPTGEPLRSRSGASSYGMPWTSAPLTPFHLVSGSEPQAADDVVIDAELAAQGGWSVGDRISILSSQPLAGYTITGIAAPPTGEGLPRQASLFFTMATAQTLANANGMVDALGVVPEPSIATADVAKTIARFLDEPALSYLTGSARAAADPTSNYAEQDGVTSVLAVMGGFAGFVSIFVLAGTFALSVDLRRREVGLLRVIGVTPRQVRTMIAGEALVLAVAGILVAIPGALLAAKIYARLLIRLDLAPTELSPSLSIWPFLIAFSIGFLISQVAAFGAARRASRIHPVEALREASISSRTIGVRRFLLGVLLIILGFVAMGLAMSTESDFVVPLGYLQTALFLVGVAVLGPLLVRPFTLVVGKVLGRLGRAPGYLAEWRSRRSPGRVAAVAAPLTLAIGFACLMFSMSATLESSTVAQSRERTRESDLIVTSSDAGLPYDVLPRIAGVPGVEAAAGMVATNFTLVQQHSDYTDYWAYDAVVVDPTAFVRVADLGVRAGSLANLRGDSLALSRLGAGQIGASVGDAFDLRLADGTTRRVTVVAIYDRGLGFGDALLPASLMLDRVTNPLYQQIFVEVADGADIAAVEEGLGRLTADWPTIQVLTTDQFSRGVRQTIVQGGQATYLLIGVSVFFATLAVVNTMAMSTAQRVREFALLRLIGSTIQQVRAMVTGEALVVVVAGSVLGTAISLSGMFTLSRGLTGDAGSIAVPPVPVIATVCLGTAISLVSHLVPASVALSSPPVEEIGTRE